MQDQNQPVENTPTSEEWGLPKSAEEIAKETLWRHLDFKFTYQQMDMYGKYIVDAMMEFKSFYEPKQEA